MSRQLAWFVKQIAERIACSYWTVSGLIIGVISGTPFIELQTIKEGIYASFMVEMVFEMSRLSWWLAAVIYRANRVSLKRGSI